MRGRVFTPAEDRQLLTLRQGGASFDAIGKRLDRPGTSCCNRYKRLAACGIAPASVNENHARLHVKEGGAGERKPRRCLCCNKEFPSAHAGNRLCNGCRTKSVSPFAPAL